MLTNRMEGAGARVGTTATGYNESRNIKSSHGDDVDVIDVEDRIGFLKKLWHRASGNSYSMALHSFSLPVRSAATIIHTFNSIVLRDIPWVTTYETSLPRASNLPLPFIRLAWKRLADPNCVRILALSDCARRRLMSDMETNRAGVKEATLKSIKSKLDTLHPPQDVLVEIGDKDFSGPLRLSIVGHDFYRKGGLELLVALDVLVARGLDFHLSIAGKMVAGDYASRAGDREVAQAYELIEKHSRHIDLLGDTSPGVVVETLRRSHLLCLPTWGDTYGYSVLEGQASGCPAITTDLRALPEINSNKCGWLIPVPKLPNGDGDLGTSEKRRIFRGHVIDGLVAALAEASHDREILRFKAAQSLQRIRDCHDPDRHSKRLNEIYTSLAWQK